jgi:hypothetical protein
MKANLLNLLVVLLIMLTSATSSYLYICQPAQPKLIKLKYFDSQHISNDYDIDDYIQKYISAKRKHDWQFKSISGGTDNYGNSRWIIVMEKY